MRKILVLLLIAGALASAAAFAHGGKTHRLLGTVKALHENQLTVTTTEGKEAAVLLTDETKYEQDGKPADRAALVAGARVSIQLDEDDKRALKIKVGTAGAPQQR